MKKGDKIEITDPKLTRIFGKQFYLLWNIPKENEVVKSNGMSILKPLSYTKLWALGNKPDQDITTCYAGESQFKLV